ncbi:phosphate-starvation-inducible PsiE family protein [Prolixibacter denitrificans]|nr:phosphate-starvation-inducible PsiE family protein [Prolixibacter denitrificans]
MNQLIEKFERFVIWAMLLLLGIVVIVSVFEFAVLIFKVIFIEPHENAIAFDINHLDSVFGLFFSILIGLELFETVKVYLKDNIFHAEIILLVAIIAVARKVVLLDYSDTEGLTMLGIGFIILSLATGYYLLKKGNRVKSGNKLIK